MFIVIQVYKLDIASRVLKLKMPPIKSVVWSYFKRSSDGKTVKCTLCEVELTFCGVTTNMHNLIQATFVSLFTLLMLYQHSFFVDTVIHWNHLPNSVVHANSLEAFKTALRNQRQ